MSLHLELQHSIREAISRPDFEAALPPLSDQTWMKILANTSRAAAENDRLEFLGDALMYATIGRQLYAQIPNGTPHLYTVCAHRSSWGILHVMRASATVHSRCLALELDVRDACSEAGHPGGK